MDLHKWTSFVYINELPTNGVFACTITDDVLDPDAWPVWILTMKDGIITHQTRVIDGVYGHENMVGWDKRQLAEWVQYEPSIARHPQEFHSIMYLGC
jgi:hypothetical protein